MKTLPVYQKKWKPSRSRRKQCCPRRKPALSSKWPSRHSCTEHRPCLFPTKATHCQAHRTPNSVHTQGHWVPRTTEGLIAHHRWVSSSPWHAVPRPKKRSREISKQFVSPCWEKQALDHRILGSLVQGQKELKTRLDTISEKCGQCQDKVKAQARVVGSIHAELQTLGKDAEELKKRVKQSVSAAELTTVQSHVDDRLAKLTTCLLEIQNELTKPKDSAPNSSLLKASLARQEAQLQLLSQEVTGVKSQMETEFVARRSKSRSSSQHLTWVSNEHRCIKALFGPLYSGLREGMQLYHNQPENPVDPRQHARRVVWKDTVLRDLNL